LNIVPVFHARGDKLGCQSKENNGWYQGKGDKGDHQLCAQPMTEDVLLPFKYELNHIAGSKIEKEEQKDHIYVHEGENNYVAAHRELAANLKEVALKVGKENYQREGDDNNDSLSSPPPSFCGTIS